LSPRERYEPKKLPDTIKSDSLILTFLKSLITPMRAARETIINEKKLATLRGKSKK
jgi:hypothetical protein